MKHLNARRWFRIDAHEGEGGQGGGDGGQGGGDGGGAGAGGDDGGQGGEGGQGGQGGDGKTFDEAAVNRIVQERLARERQKYADYDDIKAKAERFDEIEAENQSDLEKAERERDQEKAAREAAEARARKIATRNAVLEQAGEKGITDPKLAARLLDGDQVEFDDDGEPTNIGDLLDELATEHPILTATVGDGGEGGDGGSGAGAGSADGGAKGTPPPKDFTTASDDEFAGELAKHGLRPRR